MRHSRAVAVYEELPKVDGNFVPISAMPPDRPLLSPEDARQLEAAQRSSQASEEQYYCLFVRVARLWFCTFFVIVG